MEKTKHEFHKFFHSILLKYILTNIHIKPPLSSLAGLTRKDASMSWRRTKPLNEPSNATAANNVDSGAPNKKALAGKIKTNLKRETTLAAGNS